MTLGEFFFGYGWFSPGYILVLLLYVYRRQEGQIEANACVLEGVFRAKGVCGAFVARRRFFRACVLHLRK